MLLYVKMENYMHVVEIKMVFSGGYIYIFFFFIWISVKVVL